VARDRRTGIDIGYGEAMSETSSHQGGIEDEDLPDDLQPSDDNPLAQPLDADEAKTREELDVLGGKTPERSGDDSPEDSGGDSGS